MADALSRTPSLVMLHFPGFMALCCTLKLLLQARALLGYSGVCLVARYVLPSGSVLCKWLNWVIFRGVLYVLGRIFFFVNIWLNTWAILK